MTGVPSGLSLIPPKELKEQTKPTRTEVLAALLFTRKIIKQCTVVRRTVMVRFLQAQNLQLLVFLEVIRVWPILPILSSEVHGPFL
jgi:hypothetical protein